MAISDPTMSVPTPTGILQGVAAFNWDGAVWQPAGRAGPSVPTPTGNLQGVAAFSGGPSWAPTGRAGPGVATPTGVLDGVAVYTWSGSQWTPPGGTETVPTPTGGLRGVAAFDWDGTAWQPAAQARSSVPTPYGVLDGVARFGWTGSAWAATGAPSLALDFMTPGTLDPRITFTRASTATYTDASGTIRTAAVNAPRWDYAGGSLRGLLIEEARANLLFPSVPDAGASWISSGPITRGGSVVVPDGTTSTTSLFSSTDTSNTQRAINVVVSALSATTAYTISAFLRASPNNAYMQVNIGPTTAVPMAYFDLTNGTAVVGADLVAGATNKSVSIVPYPNGWYRATFTFTTNAGANGLAAYFGPCTTVSATGDNRSYAGVVGQGIYVWGAQCEQGALPTSYIPTTSATIARAFDNCFIAPGSMAPWFAGPGGTWFVEFVDNTASGTSPRIIGIHSAAGITPLWVAGGNVLASYDLNMVQTANAITLGAISKGASSWAPGTGRACLNGGTIASAAMTDGFASLATSGVGILGGNPGAVNESMTGYVRRVQYWPRLLSNPEMQAVTT